MPWHSDVATTMAVTQLRDDYQATFGEATDSRHKL